MVRWKQACSFEKVLCETLARRTRSLVYACACACVCDLGWRCAPTSTHPHSQYLWLAYQVKKYTFYKSVGCIGVCARLLWESCISYNASELCGSILNCKNFHQNRSEFSAATRLEFIRVARKLIRTIKHAVWIEYYICLLCRKYFHLNSKLLYRAPLCASILKLWKVRFAKRTMSCIIYFEALTTSLAHTHKMERISYRFHTP